MPAAGGLLVGWRGSENPVRSAIAQGVAEWNVVIHIVKPRSACWRWCRPGGWARRRGGRGRRTFLALSARKLDGDDAALQAGGYAAILLGEAAHMQVIHAGADLLPLGEVLRQHLALLAP